MASKARKVCYHAGDYLRKARLDMGLSLSEVAQRANLSRPTAHNVQRFETDGTGMLFTDVLLLINALDVSIVDLAHSISSGDGFINPLILDSIAPLPASSAEDAKSTIALQKSKVRK